MSKSKFLKKLLMGGLCALTATAMIGATACNKDDGDDKKKPNPKPPVTTEDEYTVTFNLDGGTWSNGNNHSVKVENGGKLPAPATLGTPTKEGFDFGGWYNGETEIVPGVTPITSTMTVKAKWTPKQQAAAKTGVFTVSNSATDSYEAGAEISDNELFTLKAGVGTYYGKAKDSTADDKDLGLSLTNAAGTVTANQALKQSSNIDKGAYSKSLYEITAKANATVKILVHFVNDSWNSNRAGADITWSLGSGAVQTKKSVNRTESFVAIEASIPEGETLHIGVNNTSNDSGKLWLFSVEGTEEQNKVEVNYYNGAEEENNLILTQYVASGAEVVAPTANPVTISYSSKFLGWYDAATDGEEYTFGEVSATTSIYAHYKASDVTITYYDHDTTTVYKTVAAYSGYTVTAEDGPSTTDGSTFLYWSDTVDGDEYDFTTPLTAGTLELYPVYEAADENAIPGHAIIENSTNSYTIKADDDPTVTLATVTLGDGGFSTNKNSTVGTYATTVRWQSSAGAGGKILDLVLEEGYTYTVQVWSGSSGGSGRTLTLIKVEGEGEGATETTIGTATSGINNEVAVNAEYKNVVAGNYKITQDNNTRLYGFIIIATPVANS